MLDHVHEGSAPRPADATPERTNDRAKYATPESILQDAALDEAMKKHLLEDWRQELVQLSTATSENMGDLTGKRAATDGAVPEELMRRVDTCLRKLEPEA